MRLFSILLALGIIVAAVLMGGSLMNFVNAPSILVVFGVTGLGLVGAHDKAFSLILRGLTGKLSAEEATTLTHIAQTGNRLSIASGWVGVLIGLIQMLHGIEDLSVIQPATAVCLLTAFYGHTLSTLFWIPLEQSCKTAEA